MGEVVIPWAEVQALEGKQMIASALATYNAAVKEVEDRVRASNTDGNNQETIRGTTDFSVLVHKWASHLPYSTLNTVDHLIVSYLCNAGSATRGEI